MGRTLVVHRQDLRFVNNIALLRAYKHESQGNQDQTFIFVDVTIDGSGNYGQIIFGTGTTSVNMRTRTGGGIDFYNGAGTKIASLDSSGNLRTLGSITGNTTP